MLPTGVQPVKAFSKSPLVIPLGGGGAVTVRVTEALCVALAVPVTVRV